MWCHLWRCALGSRPQWSPDSWGCENPAASVKRNRNTRESVTTTRETLIRVINRYAVMKLFKWNITERLQIITDTIILSCYHYSNTQTRQRTAKELKSRSVTMATEYLVCKWSRFSTDTMIKSELWAHRCDQCLQTPCMWTSQYWSQTCHWLTFKANKHYSFHFSNLTIHNSFDSWWSSRM